MGGETTKITFDGTQGRLAAALETPDGPPKAYALFAHCFSCTKDVKAARDVSRALCAEGFAVLRFDFTGLGASEGDFANTHFSSNVDDLIKAADFLRADYAAPQILIGHSLGGAAAIVAADAVPEARGVAVIGAPADVEHVVHQFADRRAEIEQAGVAEVRLAGRPFTIRKEFLDDLERHSVVERAAGLKRALLILHAPRDETVGIENAGRIFSAAKHPKSFVSLDDADHLLTNGAHGRYAATVIAAWASRYVDAADAPRSSAAAAAPQEPGWAAAVIGPEPSLAVAVSFDGHAFTIDAAPAEGGTGTGPNPTRVVEGALAACSAMTMRLYARRKGWDLAGAQVRVRRAPDADPHAAMALEKTIRIDGALDAEQRARLLEIAGKCPVHRMLSGSVAITSEETGA